MPISVVGHWCSRFRLQSVWQCAASVPLPLRFSRPLNVLTFASNTDEAIIITFSVSCSFFSYPQLQKNVQRITAKGRGYRWRLSLGPHTRPPEVLALAACGAVVLQADLRSLRTGVTWTEAAGSSPPFQVTAGRNHVRIFGPTYEMSEPEVLGAVKQ